MVAILLPPPPCQKQRIATLRCPYFNGNGEKLCNSRTTAILRGGCARQLGEAFASGDFESLPTLEAVHSERRQRYSELEVTGCLHDGMGDDATFFVTVKEVFQEERRCRATLVVDRSGVYAR